MKLPGYHLQYDSQCGGSIIDEYHILSTASCVDLQRPEEYTVLAGAHDLSKDDEDTRQQRKIANWTIHPEWKSELSSNWSGDVSVIRLQEPFDLSKKEVQPIKMAASGSDPKATIAVLG